MTQQPTRDAARPLRMAELLGAFAFASDLAFGLELDDAAKSCIVSMRIAERLGLSEDERTDVYYTALLKDAGCTCWTSELAALWATDEIAARRELLIFGEPQSLPSFLSWVARHAGADLPPLARVARAVDVIRRQGEVMAEGFETACEVSARIARRLGLPETVQEAVTALFEQWDGKGMPRGLAGEDLPLAARIVHPTFFLVPFHRTRGRDAARRLARERRGRGFDPAVADAFLELVEDEAFWHALEGDDCWSIVLEMEPESAHASVTGAQFDDVALALADFADLKSPYIVAHSRRVAELAERLARALGCAEGDVTRVRRAALVHDIGLVAVPSRILDKPEERVTPAEQERLRLHPYHTERILNRVEPMAPLVDIVGMHHERVDGGGYYRGLPGSMLPLGSRIIAVAARFDELTHEAADRPAMRVEQALDVIAADSGTSFAQDVVGALHSLVGATPPPPRREWPAGLSDREVEVLRLAARGLKRREIATRLSISENTVRHHLEHIYNKTGTSTRVTATLFAMEHGLIE